MKKIIKVSMVVLMGSSILFAGSDMMKKFEVKSGKIEYDIKGSGNIMGMVQIKTVGKKRVIFDDYGVKDLTEESKVTKETTMGESKVKKEHTLKYMNGSIIYSVDFKQKKILRMKNPAMGMMAMMGGEKNVQQTGESMMKKIGGKKVGTDKVLDYTCDIWDLFGVKQCMYKGIPLRIESDIMGMKSMEIATKVEFDVTLNNDDFKLPDFPIYNMDIGNAMHEPTPLDRNKLEEMDARDNKKSGEEAGEAAEGIKALGAGITALAESGFDMNSGKDLTPEQEQVMQKAMMNAMGGEGKMLTMMKEEMLGGIKEMDFAKSCFGSADTLKEANSCVDKGNTMFDDNEEYLGSWTAEDKKGMLNEMAQFEKMVPCIKAAQSMEAIQKCMPEDMR